MLISTMKVLVALGLSLMFTISLLKLTIICWHEFPTIVEYGFGADPALPTVTEWLEENNLTDYQDLFREKGKLTLVSLCSYSYCFFLYCSGFVSPFGFLMSFN